jgi:pimeloyl-ACP methyl ester carboxylesterase
MGNERPKHFIVFIPGYMGSRLRDRNTGEIVWLDFPSLLRNPLTIRGALDRLIERMMYPNPDLEPAGILDQVLFVPPWAKQEHYGRLLAKLLHWRYQIDPENPQPDALTAYTFAYDWRQDNRLSAQQLGRAVESWREHHNGAKAILIGHSNGGIVARWYIQKEGGDQHVLRLFLMGSPWDGAPQAIKVMMNGLEVLGRRRFNLFNLGERMKDVIRSFPSFYQLIPYSNPFLRNQHNQDIDLFGDPSWLADAQHQALLADGLAFNRELGTELKVETLCFFGRQKPTVTAGVVTVDDSGAWGNLQWVTTEAGDGTVPERSAVHPKASAKLPFAATHGDIYANEAVFEFLQWELLGRYQAAARASLATERYLVVFEPERDVYSPGEAISVWAEVSSLDGLTPVTEADVKARLAFHSALPGAEGVAPAAEADEVRLRPDRDVPGRYEAQLKAPEVEGYYRLEGRVKIVGEPQIVLEELLSVEV